LNRLAFLCLLLCIVYSIDGCYFAAQ